MYKVITGTPTLPKYNKNGWIKTGKFPKDFFTGLKKKTAVIFHHAMVTIQIRHMVQPCCPEASMKTLTIKAGVNF